MNRDIPKLLDSLAKTKFRGSFHLNTKNDFVYKRKRISIKLEKMLMN